MPKLSIVVAAYRAEKTIGRTVESLLACRGAEQARVIVVDDGSEDRTAARAAETLQAPEPGTRNPEPETRVLRLAHVGRPAALNAGIRAAEGCEIVLFTDADCVVPPSWIEDTLAELGDYDGVGGNLLPGERTAVELAKVLRYVHEFERGADLAPPYAGVCLNGNNMAVRRAALLAVGGFDESFLHGADADLTRRLLDAGFRLRRTTRTQTTHLKVETLGAFLRTMHKRGSTVRFGMKSGEENAWTLARALFSPWKWLALDLIRAPRLARLAKNWKNRGHDAVSCPQFFQFFRVWAAPWVNLLGGYANALGRIHYYRRFRREG